MAKKTLTQQTDTLDAHSTLGDQPNINDGLTAQLKTRYDRDVNRNKDYLNSTLIAELQAETAGTSGAHAIGYDGTDDNVGDMLDTIIAAGTGSIPPDGTITNAKLATDVKVGSLAALVTTDKSDVVSAINEVSGDVDDVVTDITTEQYEENESEQTTTSTSYVDALTLTASTTDVYMVHFTAAIKSSSGSEDPSIQAIHNAAVIDEFNGAAFATVEGDNDFPVFSSFAKISMTATDTIKWQFKITGGTATIKNARIHIKKYLGS